MLDTIFNGLSFCDSNLSIEKFSAKEQGTERRTSIEFSAVCCQPQLTLVVVISLAILIWQAAINVLVPD
jgi:hypothetical protein